MEANTKARVELCSWNRFHSRGLVVLPEVIGRSHVFDLDGASIEVTLPSLEQVDRDQGHDEVATVGARLTADNRPLEYRIFKVDVGVRMGELIDVDPRVLLSNANAYDLIPVEQQQTLSQTIGKHGATARAAYQYWLAVLRWTADDYRIGMRSVRGNDSGWTTRLNDSSNGKTIWIESPTVNIPGYHRLSEADWHLIQQRITDRAAVPIYIAMKHEAQEFATFGDYRRAIIDLAVACETFIRQTVLGTLPNDIRDNIWKFVEEGNINQYVSTFLPSLLGQAAATQYRKTLKEELSSLFAKRNDIMHRGDATGATSDNCRRFVKVLEALLELVPRGMAEARTPTPSS